jgi:glycerol-3-phosphate acyltransferase PlsY
VTEIVVVVIAYLLGSIPFAYLAGRMRGIDIRTVGSKNVGATNVFRTLGKGIGVAVMVLDIAKGLIAVLIAHAETGSPWPLIAAAAAILGHVFPVWLRFKGGKGVAVAGGAMIGLVPVPALIVVVIWLVIVAITRYVSVGSILAAVALPLLVVAFGAPWPTLVFACLASVVLIVRHRANMRRLMHGDELRLEFGKKRSATDAEHPGDARR